MSLKTDNDNVNQLKALFDKISIPKDKDAQKKRAQFLKQKPKS